MLKILTSRFGPKITAIQAAALEFSTNFQPLHLIWESEIFDQKKPKGSMKIQFQKKKWLFYEGEEITGTLDHMSSCPNDMKSEPIRTSGEELSLVIDF